ncbi:hypothetical protein HOC80_03010 [archaeon]|jgi:hypothetical protein|nr:hypothetical protein [archaeon]MBT4417049.1 hypothetical protein [archaeon]
MAEKIFKVEELIPPVYAELEGALYDYFCEHNSRESPLEIQTSADLSEITGIQGSVLDSINRIYHLTGGVTAVSSSKVLKRGPLALVNGTLITVLMADTEEALTPYRTKVEQLYSQAEKQQLTQQSA